MYICKHDFAGRLSSKTKHPSPLPVMLKTGALIDPIAYPSNATSLSLCFFFALTGSFPLSHSMFCCLVVPFYPPISTDLHYFVPPIHPDLPSTAELAGTPSVVATR